MDGLERRDLRGIGDALTRTARPRAGLDEGVRDRIAMGMDLEMSLRDLPGDGPVELVSEEGFSIVDVEDVELGFPEGHPLRRAVEAALVHDSEPEQGVRADAEPDRRIALRSHDEAIALHGGREGRGLVSDDGRQRLADLLREGADELAEIGHCAQEAFAAR